jgi:hypothetical protein
MFLSKIKLFIPDEPLFSGQEKIMSWIDSLQGKIKSKTVRT